MAKKSNAKPQQAETPANYVVFARRFRPQTFESVVGQKTITAGLRHALRTGRIAQAYLFCGPRGVGKTSLARIFSKALNCTAGTGPNGVAEEPCNVCEACQSIQYGRSLDVIEMDAATNRGINEIRELRDNVGLAPSTLRYKIYIVDEVHMLTNEAWNAFLKTLEEPPPHVKFIFATTDADRIPETILSRCQRFDLRRIGSIDIVERLKQICEQEDVAYSGSALERIANLSKGGLRDAESMLDQAVNLGEGKVDDEVVRQISGAAPDSLIFSLLTGCAEGKTAEVLLQATDAIDAGSDPDELLSALIERLRGTLLGKACGLDSRLMEGQAHLKPHFEQLGKLLNEEQLLLSIQLFTTAQRQLRDAVQARLPLEMALIRASKANQLVELSQLIEKLDSGLNATPRNANPPNNRPPTGHGVREGPRPNSAGRLDTARTSSQTAPRSQPHAPVPSTEPNPLPSAAPIDNDTHSFTQPLANKNPDASLTRDISEAGSSVGFLECWQEILAATASLRPDDRMLLSYLSHVLAAKIKSAEAQFEIVFAEGQHFYRQALEKKDRLDALQQAVAKIVGQRLKVVFKSVPESNVSCSISSISKQPSMAASHFGPSQSSFVSTTKAETHPAHTFDSGHRHSATDLDDSFRDPDALPLDLPPPEAQEFVNEVRTNEDADDETAQLSDEIDPEALLVRLENTRSSESFDDKLARQHPLVKAVVERFDGSIVSVRPLPQMRESKGKEAP